MTNGIENRRKIYEKLNINFAVVSAIIERQRDGKTEILIQTRWKPETDPKYSGMIEIPAGCINQYENVYEAIEREILEETGLRVKQFKPNIRTRTYSNIDDDCFAFIPFCCQQQLKGGWPRVGFVFRCEVYDEEPIPSEREVKEIRWVIKSELEKIVRKTPEKVFTLQLGVLQYYLSYDDKVKAISS